MVDNQGGLDATRVWIGGATGTFAPGATMFRAASTANKRAQFYRHDFTSASLNGTYVLFPCGPIPYVRKGWKRGISRNEQHGYDGYQLISSNCINSS